MSTALQCPQCMAPLNANSKKCDYCQTEIFVSSVAYLSTKDANTVSRYLSAYQEMLDDNPRNLEANVGIGVCFMIRGIHTEAKKYFSVALQINLSCANAYYYRTVCDVADIPYERLDIKIISEALKYLKLAYDISPEPHIAYFICKIIDKFYIANYLRAPKLVRDVYNLKISQEQINESELSKINDLVKF